MAPIGISLLICILLIDLIDAKLGEHWPYTILYDPEYELARLYLARLHMRVEVDTRDKTLYIYKYKYKYESLSYHCMMNSQL